MASELPLPQALKVAGKNVYVGHPKQLVDLLATNVATPIIEITRTKGGMPLYKLKLRCKTLFEGNLDVCFLLDFPNQPLTAAPLAEGDKFPEVLFQLPQHGKVTQAQDKDRAEIYGTNLEAALNFWAGLMEEQVRAVYPDKHPAQVDKLAREGIISMKPNVFGDQTFELESFIRTKCMEKKGIPCFRVAFGWIGSKEDPRSEDHPWGFKFELSPFVQTPPVARVRRPVSAADKKVELDKKRKALDELNPDTQA